MKGRVKTREKCPSCGLKFVEEVNGLFCHTPSCNRRRPETYFIPWYWDGKKHRITRHPDDNQLLKDFTRASRLLGRMRDEADRRIFDITHYVQAEIERFSGQKLFFKWYRDFRREWRPSYRTEVRRYVRDFFVPIGAQVLRNGDCRSINSSHVDDFYRKLPAGIKNKTKKNIMSSLRKFCSWLVSPKMILQIMPAFPVIKTDKPVKYYINKETQALIISKMHPHDQTIFNFWRNMPIRNGELRVLRARHFDLPKWVVSIEDAMSEKEIGPRKNREPYYLPLPFDFDRDLLNNKRPDDFAFLNRVDRPYTQERLEKIWDAASAKVGIKIRMYHGMRRSKATQMRLEGAQLDDIRRVLGQKQLPMANEYADVDILLLSRVLHGGAQEGRKREGAENKVVNIQDKLERVAGFEPARNPTTKSNKSNS